MVIPRPGTDCAASKELISSVYPGSITAPCGREGRHAMRELPTSRKSVVAALLLPMLVFLSTPRQDACRKQRRRPVDEGSHFGAEVAIGRIEHMHRQRRGLPRGHHCL